MPVTSIDPNTLNNPIFPDTGIPDSSTMFIFVEFTASRRNRTILTQRSNGQLVAENINGITKNSVTISMMGFDQNPNSSTYRMHTTKYVNNEGAETQWEGFGINNIKIVINASYVPQVNIEFIDTRGVAFFNRSDSPYRILYDIPPPIFSLTVKGYYGRSLTYQLHLVKYYTKLDSKTGNYSISTEFVGLTFAPLTDVLFQYIIQFPQMPQGENTSVSPSQTSIPKNTYELITKTQTAFDNLGGKVKGTVENAAFENAKANLLKCNDFFTTVESFGTNPVFGSNTSDHAANFVYLTNTNTDQNGNQLTTPIYTETKISDYNTQLQVSGSTGAIANPSQHLILAYKYYTSNAATMNAAFPKLSTQIQQRGNAILGASNAPTIETPTTYGTTITYYGIDITKLYVSAYKQTSVFQSAANTAQSALVAKINNFVTNNLGMKPTIYNIFNILCNDIDNFFNTIRTTAIKAETKHNLPAYKSKIAGSGEYHDTGFNAPNDTTKYNIFAFPDFIQQSSVQGGIVNTKKSPKQLAAKLGTGSFPEIDLIDSFIGTYLKTKENATVTNMKSQTDESGNFKWVPIGPIDLKNNISSVQSPYFGIDSTTGIGTTQNPASQNNKNAVNAIFSILLYRYYVLTQFTFNNPNNGINSEFFSTINKGRGNDLSSFYSEAEATNLANSLSNSTIIGNIQSVTTPFVGNGEAFLNYCKTNLPNLITFGYAGTPNWFSIDTDNNSFNTSGVTAAFLDKTNANFQGASIPSAPSTRTPNSTSINITGSDGSNNFIEVFINKQNPSIFTKFFNFFTGKNLPNVSFTQDNSLFVKDTDISSDLDNVNKQYVSRYLFGQYSVIPNPNNINKYVTTNGNYSSTINNSILKSLIRTIDYSPSLENIVGIWTTALKTNYANFYSLLSATNNVNNVYEIRNLIIFSNFGATLSPFSDIGDLNSNFFNLPAYFEVPEFFLVYMGLICTIAESYKTDNILYDNVVNFYDSNALYNYGVSIFADINDCVLYMSAKDSAAFINEYNNFINLNINDIIKALLGILSPTIFNPAMLTNTSQSGLDPNQEVFIKITNKNYLSVYSTITFRKSLLTGQSIYYESLSKQISQAYTNQRNGAYKYFGDLFSKLNGPDLLPKIKQTKLDIENQFNSDINDEDIYTQTYYSFQNIYDKWIAGLGQNATGAPFNNGKNLIDRFVFVDRAMNPIGDTIIDPKDLLEMADIDKNADINVFTVMSRILSKNGFEFFPLQNFMTYAYGQNTKPGSDNWDNAFKIFNTVQDSNNDSNFVCMYIGGFSKRPNSLSAADDYLNDGLINFTDNTDFNTTQNQTTGALENLNQLANNKNFPFQQVRAFAVNFGAQNQSMFYDVDLDSKEFPETNESLTLLSQIAGDNKKQAPTAKAQNLFNVYEARSYKATVHGLGNVMIQPTEYFQLNNNPMFSGIYLILGVEHDINSSNFMTTHFTGVKLAKNPIPIVKNPFLISGYPEGSSLATNQAANDSSITNLAFNAGDLTGGDLNQGLITLLV